MSEETDSADEPAGSAPGGASGTGERMAGMVPAVARALSVLDLLAQAREPMGVARLAARLSLPKSTTHGLCNTLAVRGYLRRHDDGSYFIGPRVMSLAQAFIARTNVAQEFAAVCDEVLTPADETLVLSVLDGAEVVYVAMRHGDRPLGLSFSVGMRLPAHLAATGRAMLAFQAEAQVRRLLPPGALPRLTSRGPATPDELLQELAQVRARGHSIDDETVREGVYCIGAPVFDAAGAPVAGVGVCVHKATLGGSDGGALFERHRASVLHVAQQLTQRLGGHPPVLTGEGSA